MDLFLQNVFEQARKQKETSLNKFLIGGSYSNVAIQGNPLRRGALIQHDDAATNEVRQVLLSMMARSFAHIQYIKYNPSQDHTHSKKSKPEPEMYGYQYEDGHWVQPVLPKEWQWEMDKELKISNEIKDKLKLVTFHSQIKSSNNAFIDASNVNNFTLLGIKKGLDRSDFTQQQITKHRPVDFAGKITKQEKKFTKQNENPDCIFRDLVRVSKFPYNVTAPFHEPFDLRQLDGIQFDRNTSWLNFFKRSDYEWFMYGKISPYLFSCKPCDICTTVCMIKSGRIINSFDPGKTQGLVTNLSIKSKHVWPKLPDATVDSNHKQVLKNYKLFHLTRVILEDKKPYVIILPHNIIKKGVSHEEDPTQNSLWDHESLPHKQELPTTQGNNNMFFEHGGVKYYCHCNSSILRNKTHDRCVTCRMLISIYEWNDILESDQLQQLYNEKARIVFERIPGHAVTWMDYFLTEKARWKSLQDLQVDSDSDPPRHFVLTQTHTTYVKENMRDRYLPKASISMNYVDTAKFRENFYVSRHMRVEVPCIKQDKLPWEKYVLLHETNVFKSFTMEFEVGQFETSDLKDFLMLSPYYNIDSIRKQICQIRGVEDCTQASLIDKLQKEEGGQTELVTAVEKSWNHKVDLKTLSSVQIPVKRPRLKLVSSKSPSKSPGSDTVKPKRVLFIRKSKSPPEQNQTINTFLNAAVSKP